MSIAQSTATPTVRPANSAVRFRRGSRLLLAISVIGFAVGLALLQVDAPTLRGAMYGWLMTVVMYRDQDTIWFAVLVAFCLYLCWSLRHPRDHLEPAWLSKLWPDTPNVAVTTGAIAAAVLLFSGLGAYWLHHAHDVSIDEYLPHLQAEIFLSGRLLAPAPAEWEPLTSALFPFIFFHDAPNDLWGSAYRPVHAAIRAAFALLSLETVANAIMAALSVVLIVAIARRLWPDRPDAAILAAVLLATGPQFLFTSMTGFAWSAHLCLNLLWLWLFLRDDRMSHGLAAAVGVAAVGLHQINVHPLFVMPFMLSLLWGRRWSLAAFYAVVYGAAILFWANWLPISSSLSAAPAMDGIAQPGPGVSLDHVSAIMGQVGLLELLQQPLMAINLLRLLAWQNIMLVPLVIVALRPWSSAPRPVRLLAWGCLLMMIPYAVIMPNQYYAWGYRYAHALLGSFALIAAHGWVLLSSSDRSAAAVARRAIIAFTALLVLVGLPLRAWQFDGFVRPFAEANRYIHAQDTDIVLVDVGRLWFPSTVIRNDPLLRDRPLVLSYLYMSADQVREVCRNHSVTVLDETDLAPLGVFTRSVRPWKSVEEDAAVRAVANGPDCRG